MDIIRPLFRVGSSKKDLDGLPPSVVDDFGYGLYLAQIGKRRESSKVLRGFGDSSVVELIESRASGTYRAVYTVRFPQAVFVLHVFQKKSKHGIQTPKSDVDLIAARLRQATRLVKEFET